MLDLRQHLGLAQQPELAGGVLVCLGAVEQLERDVDSRGASYHFLVVQPPVDVPPVPVDVPPVSVDVPPVSVDASVSPVVLAPAVVSPALGFSVLVGGQ